MHEEAVVRAKDQARRAMARGQWNEAAEALEAHLEAQPEDLEAILLLATVSLLRDDRREFAVLLRAASELVERSKGLPERLARLWDRCLALGRRAGLAVALAGAVAGCSRPHQERVRTREPVRADTRQPAARQASGSRRPSGVVPPEELERIRSTYPEPRTLSTAQLRAKLQLLRREVSEAEGATKVLLERIQASYRAELAKRVPEARAGSRPTGPTDQDLQQVEPPRPRPPMSKHRYSAGVLIRRGEGTERGQ